MPEHMAEFSQHVNKLRRSLVMNQSLGLGALVAEMHLKVVE